MKVHLLYLDAIHFDLLLFIKGAGHGDFARVLHVKGVLRVLVFRPNGITISVTYLPTLPQFLCSRCDPYRATEFSPKLTVMR